MVDIVPSSSEAYGGMTISSATSKQRKKYRVYRLSGTLSEVRRTKKIFLSGPSLLVTLLFPWKNTRVLIKRSVKNLLAETFSLFRTLLVCGGIFAELRTVLRTECCAVFRGVLPERSREPLLVGMSSQESSCLAYFRCTNGLWG